VSHAANYWRKFIRSAIYIYIYIARKDEIINVPSRLTVTNEVRLSKSGKRGEPRRLVISRITASKNRNHEEINARIASLRDAKALLKIAARDGKRAERADCPRAAHNGSLCLSARRSVDGAN